MITVSTALDEHDVEAVDWLADTRGVSRSAILRTAVLSYLDGQDRGTAEPSVESPVE